MTAPETPPWVDPKTCAHVWNVVRDKLGSRWWSCSVCRTTSSGNPNPETEQVVITRGELDDLRRARIVAERQTAAAPKAPTCVHDLRTTLALGDSAVRCRVCGFVLPAGEMQPGMLSAIRARESEERARVAEANWTDEERNAKAWEVQTRALRAAAQRQTDALVEIQRLHTGRPFPSVGPSEYDVCQGCGRMAPCETKQAADRGLGL